MSRNLNAEVQDRWQEMQEWKAYHKLPVGTIVPEPRTREIGIMTHYANEERTVFHKGGDARRCPLCVANKLTFEAANS